MAVDIISNFGVLSVSWQLGGTATDQASSTNMAMPTLTGQVPPLTILSKDRASGMPYGQLELEPTESLAEPFSEWREEREDST
jgi:hypothetical protein